LSIKVEKIYNEDHSDIIESNCYNAMSLGRKPPILLEFSSSTLIRVLP